MNRRVVAAVAAGLARWLRQREAVPSVVIGFDARHQSDVFAQDLAEILAGAGVDVAVLPGPMPTPVLAFAIGHLAASAGVMVTASHNPATDSGLKVYLGDTSQIAPPVDTEIAESIARVGSVDSLPRSSEHRTLSDEVVDAYLDAVVGLVGVAERTTTVAYTPLHGVGGDLFVRAAARAGFADVHVVDEQATPDPDFPSLAFPNPEEPGAMDRVLDLGETLDAEIVVAHDPDADRCAVAVVGPNGTRVLTGDEVGALLGDHLLRAGRPGTYASSIVSSDLLGLLAAARGRPWLQTLTGFKWIGKVPDLAFGYEEALGYCVAPHISRDKDGISAALMILAMAEELKASGLTLVDRLDELSQLHGYHLTDQVSVRLTDSDEMSALMIRLRSEASVLVSAVQIEVVNDLQDGFRGLPPTDGLRLAFDGGRIFVRPSGTEPKLKFYVEVVDPDEIVAQATLDVICAELRNYLDRYTESATNPATSAGTSR
jgi:phosphomannomutase